MSTFKYQEEFASDLAAKWIAGERSEVRLIIRQLKNKAQAAYIAAAVCYRLDAHEGEAFINFVHPNNQ